MNIHTVVIDKSEFSKREISTSLRQDVVFRNIKKLKGYSTKIVINNIITILLY